MTIYNYFINFIEGLLLSSFMAYYFNVKRKKMYILITTIICFFEISISNYYNTFDQLLIFIVIATLFISLLKLKTESLFEKIIICSIAGIFLYLANLLSMLVTTFIFNISTLEIYTKNYYVFCTILSKFILLCFIIFACIFKRHFYDSLTMKNGWAILLLCLMIEYTIAVLLETLLTGAFSTKKGVSLTISLIVISGLFLFIFRKLQTDNEKRLQYELKLQKNHFSEENYSKMKYMYNEIIETEHRMMYILIGIKKYLESNQIDKANFMLEQYITKVKRFSATINTNNPYFDFVLSSKIHEFMYDDIFLKNTLFICENPIYDTDEFCDLIIYLLDSFKDNLNSKTGLSLGIHQENNFIIMEIIGDLKEYKITDTLYKKIEYFTTDYSLKNVASIYTLKLVIDIDIE